MLCLHVKIIYAAFRRRWGLLLFNKRLINERSNRGRWEDRDREKEENRSGAFCTHGKVLSSEFFPSEQPGSIASFTHT